MNRNQLNFACIYEDTLQIFTHVFICVYRSLYRVGTLKTPGGDLADIYYVTDFYYVKKKYGADRERGKIHIWGHTCEAGQLS